MENFKQAGILIKSINNLAEIKRNEFLNQYNLTGTQASILMFLFKNKGIDIHQKDLESKFNLSNPDVTGILNRLETKGYVKREKSEIDSRYRKIILTDKIEQIWEQVHGDMNKHDCKVKNMLTKEEIDTLIILLDKVYKIMLETSNVEVKGATKC